MQLKLGISTCPNDTFMFYALINKEINLQNFQITTIYKDIEELNKLAINNLLDIAKVSVGVLPYISDNYQFLSSGYAMGKGNGPLLIAKNKIKLGDLHKLKIAIPGRYTTANLLLSRFFPNISDKIEYLFSDIEDAILKNEVDAGLIIHENRFTYQNKGLVKIADLGEIWEKETNLPLPLGAIAIRKNLGDENIDKFDKILNESINFAIKNKEKTKNFIKKYSQSLQDEVIEKHIELYVNEYSVKINNEGEKALEYLLNTNNIKKNLQR